MNHTEVKPGDIIVYRELCNVTDIAWTEVRYAEVQGTYRLYVQSTTDDKNVIRGALLDEYGCLGVLGRWYLPAIRAKCVIRSGEECTANLA